MISWDFLASQADRPGWQPLPSGQASPRPQRKEPDSSAPFQRTSSPQIHLARVVFGDVREGLVLRKELDKWLLPKGLLELGREGRGRMRCLVYKSHAPPAHTHIKLHGNA